MHLSSMYICDNVFIIIYIYIYKIMMITQTVIHFHYMIFFHAYILTFDTDVCPALLVLRIADKCHQEDLLSLSSDTVFSEPQIALILQKENPGQSPVFLSSSMACRDFDNFSGITSSSSSSTRRLLIFFVLIPFWLVCMETYGIDF
jgi:hypothetical protein